MTYHEFAALAIELPEVSERVGKRDVDLMRGDRHIGRLREKGRAYAIRLPWDHCDRLLAEDPATFFLNDHYQGYPYVLAWLDKLDEATARRLLQASWEAAPTELPVFRRRRR